MLTFLLFAQIAAATGARSAPLDSNYATTALRDFVAAAAESNRQTPAALRSYRSRIETESSLLIRDTLGREHTAEVEQMATAATWERGGKYELHVIGYRSHSVGVPYSTLSIVRGWTVPSLYGERLSLGTYFARPRRGMSDTLVAVHPFARDRDHYYRFSGGDTVTTLRAGSRSIPIVRIRVKPDFQSPTRFGAFDGEIDLDADRKQIVRMRGQFVVLGGGESIREKIARVSLGVTAVAYIEFVNAEVRGEFWLPAFQRTEFQAALAVFGQDRPVFRLVSTIRDIVINDSTVATSDSVGRTRVSIDWATDDSVSGFKDWQHPIGTESGLVHSDDFADLAPDVWKSVGPPRLVLFPNTLSHVFRFNRVEGLFMGASPSVDFRSVAPGLSAGVNAGWAFTEKTMRGGAYVALKRDLWSYSVRGERVLASTNDFVPPLSDDPGLGALLGSFDPYDYVDRSATSATVTRFLGSINTGLLTAQAGVGRDRAERTRLTKGVFGSTPFIANRGVLPGDYGFAAATLELHPNVTGEYVMPGFGATLHQEVARGDLTWQRTELGLSARKYVGDLSLALHGDVGIVTGSVLPPQKLFELGGNEVLPGYEYKQFAGDRAALVRGFASYRFAVLRKPLRIWRYYVPGLSPGIGASAQGGWAEISSPAAAAAVRLLGVDVSGAPLSSATGGMRATAGAGLTFFSDFMHIGAARPVDHAAPWRIVVGFGTQF
jgi:hypothetical protein